MIFRIHLKMKITTKLIAAAALVLSATTLFAQKTYDELSQVTRLNRGVYGLVSMNDGEHYMMIGGGGTCIVRYAFKTGEVVTHVRILAAMLLATLILSIATPLSGYVSLMIVCGVTAVILGVVAIKMRAMVLLWPIILFVYAMVLVPTCDALFSNLKSHQQDRILTYVGVKSDPKGIDYNVNQSLIAIGSGGMWGKGFLEGTQTKYDYLPEKHTDFIFCTVGEEWGFFGTTIVVILYISLILRLMLMGERIKEPFGRVYCYAVAAILLFHVWVNIGMTIGLMPVMGIPLPLMSYGGSSLVAMTILIMIAIRLDASTEDESVYLG